MSESWAEYVRTATAGMTQTEAAEKTGVAQTAISRWLRGNTEAPRAEHVVAFARGLGLNVIEALIAARFVTAAEAKVRKARTPLSTYETLELLDELTRRTLNGPGPC